MNDPERQEICEIVQEGSYDIIERYSHGGSTLLEYYCGYGQMSRWSSRSGKLKFTRDCTMESEINQDNFLTSAD